MSLTSQLSDGKSPIRKFFATHEDKKGATRCVRMLQGRKLIALPEYEVTKYVGHSFTGTTLDYLLRYTANANNLLFEKTIAAAAVGRANINYLLGDIDKNGLFKIKSLFEIGKKFLDGRNADEDKAIYSGTALAMTEKYFRSGMLPALFDEKLSKDKNQQIKKAGKGKTLKEKVVNFLFDEYYEHLGGQSYANDISNLVRIFVEGLKTPNSGIYQAKFILGNSDLKNSRLVDGADFDCVIRYQEADILTEIKTTINSITLPQLRQLIAYALLYNPKRDRFQFTHLGFYLARAADLTYLPLEEVMNMCLPNFGSIEEARKQFIKSIKPKQRQ